jgi:thioredoxin reductase (NADPH)
MELAPAVRLYGKRGSPQAYAIRDFLQRSGVPFEWIELGSQEQARAELGLDSVNDSRLPICIFPDGTRMEHPTVRQVTEKLGWFRHPSRAEYEPASIASTVHGEGKRLIGSCVLPPTCAGYSRWVTVTH